MNTFPAADRYLALAGRGRNDWWRYGLGIATVVVFFELLGFAPWWLMMQFSDFGTLEQFFALNAGELIEIAQPDGFHFGIQICLLFIQIGHVFCLGIT